MLSIVESLKQFNTILLDQILRIYTDHKNFACKLLNNNVVSIWRLILEEYGRDIEYIKGEKSIAEETI